MHFFIYIHNTHTPETKLEFIVSPLRSLSINFSTALVTLNWEKLADIIDSDCIYAMKKKASSWHAFCVESYQESSK